MVNFLEVAVYTTAALDVRKTREAGVHDAVSALERAAVSDGLASCTFCSHNRGALRRRSCYRLKFNTLSNRACELLDFAARTELSVQSATHSPCNLTFDGAKSFGD